MRLFAASIAIICSLLQPSVPVDASVQLDALTDEMNRSLKELHIGEHPAPFFIAYAINEIDEATLSSWFGSTPVISHRRYRVIIPNVRLGSYDLDSSWPVTTRKVYTPPVTTDDDYQAIRRSTWLSTDYEYKAAIAVAEWKKAYLRAHEVPNRLPDFTHETPVVSIDRTVPLKLDDREWGPMTQEISAVFLHYPSLQKAKVIFKAR